MIKKFQKDNKTIELDDRFSIWGAIFSWIYPLYKGLGRTAGKLFLVNIIVNLVDRAVGSSLDPLIYLACVIVYFAVIGFVTPKLMIKQLNDDKWTEVKK